MDEDVEAAAERVGNLGEDARDVVVRADVALGDEGARDAGGEVAHVLLDALALVGERDARTLVGEPLRDRPRDRALVRDAEDERLLPFEPAGHRGDPKSLAWPPDGRERVAVITGASSGIGEATARELARTGWHCVLLARRADELERIAGEIGGEWEVCDVSDRAQVDEVAARVLERHPTIGRCS